MDVTITEKTAMTALIALRADKARQQHILNGLRNESLASDQIDVIDRLQDAIDDLTKNIHHGREGNGGN